MSFDYVDVWQTPLDYPEPALYAERFAAVLAADEQARAARFRFERDRRRFVAGRFFLRSLLGAYLGLAPGSLEFTYSARGKPESAAAQRAGVHFNLSHSEGIALLALSTQSVGVDVEYRRNMDAEGLARRFFFPAECARVGCGPNTRREVFLRYWTAKEAYLKATGEGLAGLEHVEILDLDGRAPRLFEHRAALRDQAWELRFVEVPPGYHAALAVAQPMPPLRRYQCPDLGGIEHCFTHTRL